MLLNSACFLHGADRIPQFISGFSRLLKYGELHQESGFFLAGSDARALVASFGSPGIS